MLFIAFRSVVAMVLPIASTAAALGVAAGLVRLGSNLVTISDVAPVLGVLLGLGVGIDYALLILNRHRTSLRAGMRLRESVATAMDTSGRAVVFAGVTVVIALGGLLVTGIEFLYGMALSAAVSVAFTVLAAGALLPALLRIAGRRILSPADRRPSPPVSSKHAPAGPGSPAGRTWSPAARSPWYWSRSPCWASSPTPRSTCAWAPRTRT